MKQKKWIKVLSLFFSVMLLCVGVVGCNDCTYNNSTKNNGEEKYDVQIKLKNNLGEEFIFDLETSELHVEYEYTGEEIKFWVDSYNMPDHPRYGDKWLGTTSSHGIYCRLYSSTSHERPKKILEKGEYHYDIYPDECDDDFRIRYCKLFVTIV